MDGSNSIRLSELRTLTDRLFGFLAHSGVEKIVVSQSQYWTVNAESAFTSVEPPAPTMGEVFDDLHDLRAEVEGQAPGTTVIVWHAFEHLSGLMKLIAHADLVDGQLTHGIAKGA